MQDSHKKIALIGSGIVLIIIVLVFIFSGHRAENISIAAGNVPNAPVVRKYIPISASDIANAGYINPVQQLPEGTDYQAPNSYFWVNGGSGSEPLVSNTFDLLMVSQYTTGSPYTDALFNYGTSTQVSVSGVSGAQEAALSENRFALNFAKGNYYIVIIGPNQQDILALANIIAAKI